MHVFIVDLVTTDFVCSRKYEYLKIKKVKDLVSNVVTQHPVCALMFPPTTQAGGFINLAVFCTAMNTAKEESHQELPDYPAS